MGVVPVLIQEPQNWNREEGATQGLIPIPIPDESLILKLTDAGDAP